MKIAYLDIFSGAAGDMIVGSIIAAGCGVDYLQSQLDLLQVAGLRIKTAITERHKIQAIAVRFKADDAGKSYHFLSQIEETIESSQLERIIKERSLAIFRRIAKAEAKIHGVPIEKVHFHEIGAIDTIGDIISAVSGFAYLGVEKIYSSAIRLGSGLIDSEHGIIPLPSPATLEIIKGFPVRMEEVGVELTTPTGAAIITELAEFTDDYDMKIERIGYGAGSRDLDDRPNLLRLLAGETTAPGATDEVAVIETSIDDSTPEQLGYLQQMLRENGAIDLFLTPILMKKNRPAHLLTLLCKPEQTEAMATLLLTHSTSAGLRVRRESRRKLDWKIREADTKLGKVRIKVYSGYGITKFSPEYEDIVALATANKRSFGEVYNLAMLAAATIEEKQL